MKLIFVINSVLLSIAVLLGLGLQNLGVQPEEGFMMRLAAAPHLWPVVSPAFGLCLLILVTMVNHKPIGRLWNAQKLEKEDARLATLLFAGPALALFFPTFLMLEHFGLVMESGTLLSLVALQLAFFFMIGNYALTLKYGSRGGLKTPWTLKDPRVWSQTHRFMGYGLTTVSLIGAAALFFIAAKTVILAHVAAVVVVKFSAAVYSFIGWRRLRGALDVT